MAVSGGGGPEPRSEAPPSDLASAPDAKRRATEAVSGGGGPEPRSEAPPSDLASAPDAKRRATETVSGGLLPTDHKVTARRYLWTGLLALVLGGILALLIRWQWAYPGRAVPLVGPLLLGDSGDAISPPTYQGLFTTHGLVMIFFAITPILIGALGHFVIPLAIGARAMALPRLGAASYLLLVAGLGLAVASLLAPLGAAAAGWTSYPPLSTPVGTPGAGQTLMLLAVLVASVGSILAATSYVTTVVRRRAPGMGWMRLPLVVWGLFLAAVLQLLFVPALVAAALLLLSDRLAGTTFFVAGAAAGASPGDPLLYQHLFWIFGHPEVYILVLPAFGVFADLASFFARKPAFWYRGTVGALVGVTVLSGLVYGHHMFTTGLSPFLGGAFELLTLVISVPSSIVVVNILMTLWRGSLRLEPPLLYVLGALVVFGIGGMTGIPLGAITTDAYLHDTMWVVGHFHLIMAAASFLGSFAAIHFWFPKMFGRALDATLGRLHAVLSSVFFALTFGGQLVSGWFGQQRRLYDPYVHAVASDLLGLNRWTGLFAALLAATQLLFVANLIVTFRRRRGAPANPWDAPTLEWTCAPSPAPAENYAAPPAVVRGPHAFDSTLAASLGRDYRGQAEP